MSQATPSANTSRQIQRHNGGQGQAPADVGQDLANPAPPVTSGHLARQLPRQGVDDGRAQHNSFIDLANESSNEEDDSESEESNQAEDETACATDEESEDGSSPSYSLDDHVVPDTIRIAEEVTENSPTNQTRVYKVATRYKSYLRDLCIDTATEDADQHTRYGLPYAIEVAKSIGLDNDKGNSASMDAYAYALVIHVWQLVCLRLQNDSYPSDDVSLSTQWSSYFLSAHVLAREHNCKVSVSELKFAVQYWEERLRQRGRGVQWLMARWAKDIRGGKQDQDFFRNPTADRYLKALEEHGVTTLTSVIMDENARIPKSEQTQLAAMARSAVTLKEARHQMAIMLRSMGKPLLKAIIQGQVPRLASWESGEVLDALWRLNEGERFEKPGIYLQSICDGAGLSPSAWQWLEIIDLMIVYIGDDDASEELATDVDQIIHPVPRWPHDLAAKGLRRYMDRRSYLEKGRNKPDRHHRKMVRYFVDRLRKRMQNETLHAPMRVPVVEIGFSNHPDRRLKQHRHHESSNYLMNLAEALFRYRYPGMFRLLQCVIYKCFRPVQAWMGEIVFTQMAQGYIDGGGGFSHEPAGRSNGSSFQTLTEKEWHGLEEEVYASGCFMQDLQDEAASVQEKLVHATAKKDDVVKQHQAQLEVLEIQKRRLDLERKKLAILSR